MYYVFIRYGIVQENIPEIDPAFPEIPIEQRYQPEFLTMCVKSEEAVPLGWYYSEDTGFTEDNPFPEPPPPEPEIPLDEKVSELEEKISELEESFDILTEGLI